MKGEEMEEGERSKGVAGSNNYNRKVCVKRMKE